MRSWWLGLLLCFASPLWTATTGSSLSTTPMIEPMVATQFPWVLCGDDGSRHVTVRLTGRVLMSEIALLCANQVVSSISPRVREERLSLQVPATILSWVIPANQLQQGAYVLRVGERSWNLAAVNRHPSADKTRLVVAGVANWPQKADISAMVTRLEGAIEVVVADGFAAVDAFGSGGWEPDIPILVLPRVPSVNSPSTAEIMIKATARLGATLAQWPKGISWGNIGLPFVIGNDDATQTIARDLSVWQIGTTDCTWWELGLLAPSLTRDKNSHASLLSLCRHLDVPLMLTLGGGAAWWSEPLGNEAGRVVGQIPGTRVLSATPMGVSRMAMMPWEIVGSLDNSGLLGLMATATTLDVVWFHADKTDGMALQWSRSVKEGKMTMHSALDVIESTALHTRCFPSEPVADSVDLLAARSLASALSMRQLANMHVRDEDVDLLLAEATIPQNLQLLRRLTCVSVVADGPLLKKLTTLPPLVARDLLLRQLAFTPDFDSQPWTAYFASTTDSIAVHAVMRNLDETNKTACRDLLVARVRAQALGQTAIETDALLQHRLMTSVFDATDLSPTLLRPLAIALEPRLDDFTKGPIKRFIERHGATRR